MNRTRIFLLFATSLCMASAGMAEIHAEEISRQEPQRAVWIEPFTATPSWLDLQSSNDSPQDPGTIVASGPHNALVQNTDESYAILNETLMRKNIQIPPNAQWISLKADGQILVYNGNEILSAPSIDAAQNIDNFTPILSIPNARAIDGSEETIAYGDDTFLSIVALNDGTIRRIPLADFFDDKKVDAMTPEAIQAAADKKNRRADKKNKTKISAIAAEATQTIADIVGIWWRHDGVGIIRVRNLLNVRTFITQDNGRSWRISPDAPAEIFHNMGIIWNGKDQVLSLDGSTWLCVQGEKFSPLDRKTRTHALEILPPLPRHWPQLNSPTLPNNPPNTPSSENNSESSAQSNDKCLNFPLPSARATLQDTPQTAPQSYAPISTGGFEIGLYRDSRCLADAYPCPQELTHPASAWIKYPDAPIEPLNLPQDCQPLYLGSALGIGIALCAQTNQEDVVLYTRSKTDDWIAETRLPKTFAASTQILAANDGTVALSGACSKELRANLQNETHDVEICPIAVRQPYEIGELSRSSASQTTQEIGDDTVVAASAQNQTTPLWRIEQVENRNGYLPISGGRILTLEGQPTASRLVLRSASQTETLVESFDPSPYLGLVATDDGCLALFDGSVSPTELRATDPNPENADDARQNSIPPRPLLSTNGRLAGLSCADSQKIAQLVPNDAPTEEKKGDDHYGLRLGAGGFFTMNDVQTWFMRVEGLIPIYGGRYEIGLTYRMGGGNTSTSMGHLGLVSLRWRYDDFEKFDFAVGAGLGYGSMCGYDKKKTQDSTPNDEDSDNSNERQSSSNESGYAKCSTYSIRYQISGIATYKLSQQWKIFLGVELLGGSNWGFDLSGGIEVRF